MILKICLAVEKKTVLEYFFVYWAWNLGFTIYSKIRLNQKYKAYGFKVFFFFFFFFFLSNEMFLFILIILQKCFFPLSQQITFNNNNRDGQMLVLLSPNISERPCRGKVLFDGLFIFFVLFNASVSKIIMNI